MRKRGALVETHRVRRAQLGVGRQQLASSARRWSARSASAGGGRVVKTRPSDHAELQALAAVGQPRLMAHYETLFSALKQPIARRPQPRRARRRPGYLNAQVHAREVAREQPCPSSTRMTLELRFGDNDSLSALVAVLVGADHLATDVDALYTKNPSAPLARARRPPSAFASCRTLGRCSAAPSTGSQGRPAGWRGARLVAASAHMGGRRHRHLTQKFTGAAAGFLVATRALGGSREVGTAPFRLGARCARTSAGSWRCRRASLTLDAGAARAVRNGSTLFAAGVRRATGGFHANEAVRILDESGAEFARGVCNYSCEQAGALAGRRSEEMAAVLGFAGPEELTGRHNLALLAAATPTGRGGVSE